MSDDRQSGVKLAYPTAQRARRAPRASALCIHRIRRRPGPSEVCSLQCLEAHLNRDARATAKGPTDRAAPCPPVLAHVTP